MPTRPSKGIVVRRTRRFVHGVALALVLSLLASVGPVVRAEEAPRARSEADMRRAVYLPKYRTQQGRLTIGTAFLTRVGDVHLLVSAHHLFGPSGGLEREYGWDELATLIEKVEAVSLASTDLSITSKVIVPIEGAAAYTPERLAGDVVAFRVERARVVPLALGTRAPAGGARVFVLARDGETGETVHAARVIDTAERGMVYMFDDSLSFRGIAGAPVVDANGYVVGIHLAGAHQQGQAIGIANPVDGFRPLLEAAVAPKR